MAGGIPEREYVWLPPDGQRWGLPLAMISDAGTPGPRIHYLHTDHLGTPVAMASGGLAQVEWRASYRPFGEARDHRHPGPRPPFAGQLLDSETDFHQDWHRDYDPRLGRYLQGDPTGLSAGLNLYTYAEQNPLRYIDPEGLFADTFLDAGFIVYDLARLVFDVSCGIDENLAALGGDILGPFIPGATGIGLGIRASRNLTDSIGKIAAKTGLSPRQVREAIHEAKKKSTSRNDTEEP